jgi:hypothetical protein
MATPKYWFVDEPQERKVAKFRYVGSQEFGKAENITFYGLQWKLGEVTEVPDDYAANKLRNHFDEAFEEEDGETKKRGRPRKTDEEREADRAEREADKAAREAERARREEERAAGKTEQAQTAGAVQTDVGPDEDWDDPEAA